MTATENYMSWPKGNWRCDHLLYFRKLNPTKSRKATKGNCYIYSTDREGFNIKNFKPQHSFIIIIIHIYIHSTYERRIQSRFKIIRNKIPFF